MSLAPITIALCQMTSTDDLESNVQQIENLVSRISADAGVRLAIFPENSLYFRLREGEKIRGLELVDPVFARLAQIAQRRKLHLHLTTPIRHGNFVANASVHISDMGQVQVVYEKMHLFDISLKNGPSVRESDAFRAGSGPAVITIDGWKIGESICYDLRFAELYSGYARLEVDVIVIPSAFLVRTGEAHWDVLVRARAIESQAYVLAPAQAGLHQAADEEGGPSRETYGNSLAVDPWGRCLARLEAKGCDIAVLTLRREDIDAVREQIPMRDHRRRP